MDRKLEGNRGCYVDMGYSYGNGVKLWKIK